MRFFWVLVLMASVHAQTSDRSPFRGGGTTQKPNLEETWQSYFVQFGPHALDTEFAINGLGIDDNLFFQPKDQAVKDTIGQAVAQLDWLTRINSRNYFQTEAKAIHDWYQDESYLSDTHADLSAKFLILGKSWHGYFGYQYQSLRQNPTSEIDERPILKASGPFAFVSHELGKRVNLIWNLSSTRYDYEEGIQSSLLNRDANRIDLTAKINRRGRLAPFIQLIFEDIDFERDQQTTLSQGFIGGRNELTTRWYFDFKLGFSQLKYELAESEIDEEDWMAETYIRHQWTRRFLFEAGFVRQPVFSASRPGHFISNRVLVGSNVKVAKHWELKLSVYRGKNEYPESFLQMTETLEEDLNQIAGELIWKPNQSWQVTLESSFYDRKSDFAEREAEQQRTTISIGFKPS